MRVVKGVVTSEFRKMWGIQEEYAKKCRDNHVHHCVDAITIACIDTGAAQLVNEYYKNREIYEWQKGGKPSFNKPWETFTEDILSLYSCPLKTI